MTPHAFLDLLWHYKPEDLYILLWMLEDKRSHWFQDVAKAADFVAGGKTLDVYVGVGLSKADLGPARRCASEDIAGLGAFWSDLDVHSEAHGNKPLPATIDEALSIVPAQLPPSAVVATGNGAHAWWVLKEPHIFDSEEERRDAARLVDRWHTMLRLNAAARGWAYDRLSDLARVLRIPGTLNHKDPAHPKPVEIHALTDRRYNLSDFEEFLDEAGIPDREAQERAARDWAARFADKPLTVDTKARIPQEMLDAWMRDDIRFRNTWLRQRHDLRDQSNSGYDLALACFGVDAGLSEQMIVDLMIHHRAHHDQKQRTRLDYYQRTIAKAEKRTGGGVSSASGSPAFPASRSVAATTGPVAEQGAPAAPGAEEGSNASTPPTAATEAQKALLCQRISEAIGIPVLRLVKITGKGPQYRMELADGQKIEFQNVNKLIAYDSIRSAIAATVGKIIPKIKAKHWEQLAQTMLDACIIEPGTEEEEWVGATRIYLRHYLAERGFIPSIEDQRIQDQRKPMVIDGSITVSTTDFQAYVNKTTSQTLSVKAVAGMLSALGAKSLRVRGRFKEQSRWVLPVNECDPEEFRQYYERSGDAG